MELTDFLLARIAEDENEAARQFGSPRRWGKTFARRRIAESEAKRRIVELHEPVDYAPLGMESPDACSLCGADLSMGDWDWESGSFPCDTLKALAAVYADHPDYDESWRP